MSRPTPVEGRSDAPTVRVLFVTYAAYGGFWGAWVVVFADFLRGRDLTAGSVSLLFALLSVVAIGVMAFVAPRLEPLSRHLTLTLALVVHGVGNAAVALAPDKLLWVAFLCMGAGTGLIDVFVNAAGQEIEGRTNRAVLQIVHAAYGAGGVVGALATALAVTNGVGYKTTIVAAAIVQLGIAVLTWHTPGLRAATERASGRFSLGLFLSHRELTKPALIVLFSFFIEGSMDVWSVIFLRETLGSSVLGGAVAFAAFAFAITLGRSVAAGFFGRLGYANTILVSGIGSLLFAAIAVLSPSAALAGVAFLGLGFMLSPAAPAAFGMAEGPGGHAGLAVGAITTVGYAGFVVGPPVMGWLADNIGLRAAMSAMLAATLGMAVVGFAVRSSSAVKQSQRTSGGGSGR
jgi:MFS family permease